MSAPPLLPIPPAQYDQRYFMQIIRILSQHFREDATETTAHGAEIDAQQVLQWLS
jgi:hypothetical protein